MYTKLHFKQRRQNDEQGKVGCGPQKNKGARH